MRMIKSTIKAGCLIALFGGSTVFAQSLEEAKNAIDAEQYQKAEMTLKSLIIAQPSNAENYFYIGNLYLIKEYPDSAKATFTTGVSKDSKFPLNYVGLGAVDLYANNSSSAKTNFDKAIEEAKRKDNDPYIYAAKAYIKAPKPDYAAAVALLQKAIEMDSKDAEAYLALGDAYRGQQKNSEAFSAYRSASDLNKALLRSQVELGVINKGSLAWQEAIDVFNGVIKTNPNYGPAYRELAETYLRWANTATESADYASRIKQGLANYLKYMDLTDRSLESRMRYADFLILAKDYKTLQQEAQEMAKLDKTNPRIYRYLGYAAYENGNYPASLEALNTWMSKAEKDRLHPFDYLYLGKAQMKTDTTGKGIPNIGKALLDTTLYKDMEPSVAEQVKKGIAEQISDMAKDMYTNQKYAQAAQLYDITQSAPNPNLVGYYYQGSSYFWDYATKYNAKQNPSKDLLVKADTAFSMLLQRSPTTEAAWLGRVNVALQLDDENQKALATEPYQKFIELVTVTKPELAAKYKAKLVEAYYYLGFTSVQSDPNKAKEYFNKVLELDPANANAQQALKSLASQ